MTAGERRWLIGASLLIVLLTSLPYLVGWANSTPERPFTGVLILTDDLYSYWAKMRVGASGEWLFHNAYAVEPHPSAPVYLFYTSFGWLASLGYGARVRYQQLAAAYHIARAVFGLVMLIVLYLVIGLLLAEPRQRRLAWMLTVLSGGLGWLMLLVYREPLPLGSTPLDLYVGEAVMIVPLLILPHLLMARAALLGGVWCFVRAVESGDWHWAVAAGGCWLVATIGVPFDILVAGAIVGGWLVAQWMLTRRFPVRIVLFGVLGGLPAILFDLFTLGIIAGDPVYDAWTAQNTLPLPHPLHLISLYGLQLILALVGAIVGLRRRMPRAELFVGWLAAAPLLWLIPVPFRLRLIEGFVVPLSILVVLGLLSLTERCPPVHRRAALALLFALLLPSTLLLILGSIAQSALGMGTVYLSQDSAQAFEWLRQNAPQDSVVLASEDTGVILPGVAPVRALVGHGFETPDFSRKVEEARAFYLGTMSDTERSEWLDQYGVQYVWYGPDELAFACEETNCRGDPFDPDALPLHSVFSAGGITIYEVSRP